MIPPILVVFQLAVVPRLILCCFAALLLLVGHLMVSAQWAHWQQDRAARRIPPRTPGKPDKPA